MWIFRNVICLVDIRCKVIVEHRYEDAMDDYEKTMDAVAEHIKELLREEHIPKEKIAGVGIAFPGFVDQRNEVLRYGAINKWKNKSVIIKTWKTGQVFYVLWKIMQDVVLLEKKCV